MLLSLPNLEAPKNLFLIMFLLVGVYEQINKKITYKALSLTLTDRQDVIAENELSKITVSIQNDIKLKNLNNL